MPTSARRTSDRAAETLTAFVRLLDFGDEFVGRRLEVVAVTPDPPNVLAELGKLLPGGLRLEALPRREAHVPARVVQVAGEPKRAGPGHRARPGHEVRPRLNERVILARLHHPQPARVRLRHHGRPYRRRAPASTLP